MMGGMHWGGWVLAILIIALLVVLILQMSRRNKS
jgi:hypothetical protein